MAKPKMEKKEEDVQKLVKEYWESILDEQDNQKSDNRNNKPS